MTNAKTHSTSVHITAARRAILSVAVLVASACTTYDPLYCDENSSCKDPDRPFCDLAGEYPASDGVARTCIPSPFDAGGDPGDAGGGSAADGGGEPDGGSQNDGSPACSWSTPSELANVNTSASEYPGSFSSDGLSLYFARGTPTAEAGIYVATREEPGQAFGEPARLDELSSDEVNVADPEISPSGLEMFYRVIQGNGIQTATRASPTGAFGEPEATGLVGITPSLSSDGLAVYFVGNPSGTVQRATRSAIGAPWSEPVTVLPTGGYFSVDVSPDELRLLITLNAFAQPKIPLAIAEREFDRRRIRCTRSVRQ